jgi:hypothetical protein
MSFHFDEQKLQPIKNVIRHLNQLIQQNLMVSFTLKINEMINEYHSESRPMVITRKELDELAYLLHANVQRGDYERIDNPTKVEERKS